MPCGRRPTGPIDRTRSALAIECVAELGAATLLCILGNELEADLGGCWQYVSAYARDAEIEPMAACNRVLKRTCDAVALILGRRSDWQ